jgi:hypothetical protein
VTRIEREMNLARDVNRATKVLEGGEAPRPKKVNEATLTKLMPVPDKQGILFPPNLWLSFDSLTKC